ncbi:MAG: amino acid ABC transporter permease [Angustibacter sp.]
MSSLLAEYNIFAAFLVTIQLALGSAVVALVLGVVLAVMRVSPVASLRSVGTGYVQVLRNTPLTLIVLATSLGLYNQLGLKLADVDSNTFIVDQNFRLAVLGLGAYHAAFVCEAIRSGFNTVPAGQIEAARAIGLNFFSGLRLVVLPQALRAAITPLANVANALTKNTTVASVIGVAEASSLMKEMIEFRPDVLGLIFILMALGFVVLTLPMGIFLTWLSRQMAVAR